MTLYADPNACPDCRGPLRPTGATRCAACGLELSGPLGQELYTVLGRADDLLGRMRRQQHAPAASRTPAPASGPAPGGVPEGVPGAVPSGAPPGSPAGSAPTAGSSVPKILLALGAVCVLVAALVFLAVTWSHLGVGGRTAVLVGLTVATGALTAWMGRRTLRGATEALGLVTLGLGTLDVVGARSAGWLGAPSDSTFSLLLGGLLVACGLAATRALGRTPVDRLVVGELTAVLGLLLVGLGLVDGSWSTYPARHLVALLVAAALTTFLWRLARAGGSRYRVAAQGSSVAAVLTWLALFGAGFGQLGAAPSAASVWWELDGWPFLAAAAVAGAVSASGRLTVLVRASAAGAALVAVGVAGTAPAYDEPTTVLTLAMVAAAAVAALTTLVRRPWGAAGLGVAFLVAVHLGLQTLVMLGTAATRYADAAGRGWSGEPGGRLEPLSSPAVGDPWLLPLCVVALLALLSAAARLTASAAQPRRRWPRLTTGATLAATPVATLLLWPLPVWTVLMVVLALATAAGVVSLARTRAGRRGSAAAASATAAALTVALPLSLYDEHLTAGALGVALVLLAALHLRSEATGTVLVTGATAPLALAALAATVGAVVDAAPPQTALTGLLALSAVALGRVLLPSRVRTGEAVGAVEAGAAVGALLLALAGVTAATAGSAGWTAVYLTVAGVTATVMALLRDDRRLVAWLGGVLLVLATWVRLDDIGIREPEPYTLPSALALLVVGAVHLGRHRRASTLAALSPGLALALVPSLLWVLADPLTLRAVLLGLACLALVAGGVRLRLAAPFLYGAAVGLVVVLREAGPFLGETVPRWSLIGAAGVLLIGLGVTWEQRTQQARAATGYVGRMR